MKGTNTPGFLIGAFFSGSGKTVIACGLMKAFARRGLNVAGFKCGPDYIDPMFHKQVLGIESRNLDGFFQTEDKARESFWFGVNGRDIGVIEGVMGYFDGIGNTGRASSYEMAAWLGCPVILVADGKKAGLSLAALIRGFLEFDLPVHGLEKREWNGICGILLNRAAPGRYPALKAMLEEYLPVPVLGYVPEFDWLSIESRHLGLKLPGEIKGLEEQAERLAEELEKTVEIENLISLAGKWAAREPAGKSVHMPGKETAENEPEVTIGVAMDEAFCFYYQDNLDELSRAGARLKFFSPLHDPAIPKEADGLLLGGGYPELYARQLSENTAMRGSLKQAAEKGMPVLGECGGFLYLLESLEGEDGTVYPMAGVLSGKGVNGGKLGRFGYIALHGKQGGIYLKEGETILAHEFHYWDADCCGSMAEARKPSGDRRWLCMRQEGRVFAGFPHLYYPSFSEFAKRFVNLCGKFARPAGK